MVVVMMMMMMMIIIIIIIIKYTINYELTSLLQFGFVLITQWFSDTGLKGAGFEIYGLCT